MLKEFDPTKGGITLTAADLPKHAPPARSVFEAEDDPVARAVFGLPEPEATVSAATAAVCEMPLTAEDLAYTEKRTALLERLRAADPDVVARTEMLLQVARGSLTRDDYLPIAVLEQAVRAIDASPDRPDAFNLFFTRNRGANA